MTDQQTAWELQRLKQQVDDLERKLSRLERIMLNVDNNVATTLNIVHKKLR